MARNLDSKCKVCRRAGKKLFLKGERCYTAKCAMIRRKYPPGAHGAKRFSQSSEYGEILREKQNMKNSYGLLERQFSNYFVKAKKRKGDPSINFLTLLEKRLDNVLYRAGFFISKNKTRQVISHGLVKVNGKRLDIPSYEVEVGDSITLKEKETTVKEARENLSKKTEENLPIWFSVDKNNLEIKILRNPIGEDLPKEFDVYLVLEFYSR
ncbi:30S ribosomal protein S4 [bacterium (Candidatus Moisslbacteria) CG12_big_fil_rev_8_21_14_0_65_36_11]|nr:30S ribosomal protein S4 [Candidatus Kuenenbacteria bacterium]OIP76611.1 MAG: 30S ribosomal protein S4 [Parcubacteria group bacterium CG2_30_36_38]PIV46123.1 MAG: 30S ribosomal protein S4 [bacterium (Candidatus Moisslbacteria) CG02_land_8_20_14_3_00_36_53]PIW67682.1 MAG: 30S ribosomal protein S4 [bacterium (Candidatus Moisslbacteria) CG12_big_fil_rev_8_21_14_0_65_36_11]PIZ90341.1 MAG: 30S ribosomal protein S4 [bacterium (Candidatus Moisslbacteria) CG_4_10_14_0_2_um_filter_36_61]PJC00669.1 M